MRQWPVRLWFAALSIAAAWALGGTPAFAQIELDRVVVRVAGRTITQSDIRQAQQLRLVDDVSSPEAVRRALENRWLALAEVQRAGDAAASEAAINEGRAAWESRVGGAGRGAALLGEAGMTAEELATWHRDDARVRTWLDRQYAGLDPSARDRAVAAWYARLRQRAELP